MKGKTNKQIKEEFGNHLTVILSEMCGRVGVEFDAVNFVDDHWFQTQEWTEEQQDAFKEWLTEYLYKNAEARQEITDISYRNKRQLRRAAEMFCFLYGWSFKKE